MKTAYIVAYMLKDLKDAYTVVWSIEEAKSVYETILSNPDIYSASIARVVESTDYW